MGGGFTALMDSRTMFDEGEIPGDDGPCVIEAKPQ